MRNPYGANLYILDCSCRALLTDPDIATVLHDNHWAKYSGLLAGWSIYPLQWSSHTMLAGYYGYWYSQDIYNTDSTAKATSTNALVEASITTCCLSCLAWLGATIFLIILKRRTERRAKCKFSPGVASPAVLLSSLPQVRLTPFISTLNLPHPPESPRIG